MLIREYAASPSAFVVLFGRDSRLRKRYKDLLLSKMNPKRYFLGAVAWLMVSWDQRRIAFVESTVHSWLAGK
jgi:hypothetical protein